MQKRRSSNAIFASYNHMRKLPFLLDAPTYITLTWITYPLLGIYFYPANTISACTKQLINTAFRDIRFGGFAMIPWMIFGRFLHINYCWHYRIHQQQMTVSFGFTSAAHPPLFISLPQCIQCMYSTSQCASYNLQNILLHLFHRNYFLREHHTWAQFHFPLDTEVHITVQGWMSRINHNPLHVPAILRISLSQSLVTSTNPLSLFKIAHIILSPWHHHSILQVIEQVTINL